MSGNENLAGFLGKAVPYGREVISRQVAPEPFKVIVSSGPAEAWQCTGDGEPGGSAFREKRFAVAVKVTQAEDDAAVELELEEAGTIKKAIETRHPGLLPLFHGQALALVEGKPTGLETEED